MPLTDVSCDRTPAVRDPSGLARTGSEEAMGGRPAVYLFACGLVAVVWGAVRLLRPVPWFPLDDPYITMHAAQVLHRGSDPNFPGVSALYGSTSAPFLALEYALQFVLSPLYAADAACWLGVLAYTCGLLFLAQRLRLGRFQSLAIIILGLAASFVPVHLLNGLETGFCLAAAAWTLALSSGERPNRRGAALAAGCTVAVRPDLAPFAALVIAALVYDGWRTSRSSVQVAVLHLMKLAGWALLPVLPFALWYLQQTGVPYPVTGAAKQYYFASGKLPLARLLGPVAHDLGTFALSCGPLLLGFVIAWRSALGKAIVVFAALMVVLSFHTMPEYLFFNIYRYPVVLIPMLVWGVAWWVSRRPSDEKAHLLLGACVVWCALLIVPLGIQNYLNACRTTDHAQRELASWCEANLPADARILVQDAGYIAYGTHFRIVDYVGLKTPEAMPLNKEYTWQSAGKHRARAVAVLARGEEARFLVVSSRYAPSIGIPGDLSALGWTVIPLHSNDAYALFSLRPPAAGLSQ